MNTHGYKGEIPSKFTNEHNGRFNIPMYCVYISDNVTYAHEINAILVGKDISKLEDWMFIEPQTNEEINMRNWQSWLDRDIYIEEPYEFPDTDHYNAHVIANFFLEAKEKQTNNLENSIVLHQNYPNPATNSTKIKYFIQDIEDNISLKVYNISGQEVKTLVDNDTSRGNHWVNFDTSNLSNGTYFYKLSTPSGSKKRKMMILKEKIK
jgi:hypothetical protein